MGETPAIPQRLRARLDEAAALYADLSRRLEDPAVLADHNAVRDLSIRRAAVEPLAADAERLAAIEREAADLRAAVAAGADPDFALLAGEELPRLQAQAAEVLARLKARLVNAADRQVGSVILEVRAGTGGDEAGLWARDLLDMYQRFAARRGWAFELLDLTPDAGGVRHAVASVRGEGVWSELAFEAGVHSVKRVPATETQGRVHTSTATVAVLPEPTEVQVKIDWARDVEEHVTTSQGPGGQNVNKVATAVQLHHRPSGIVIRMQESKSQSDNRQRARRLLAARLFELERQKQHRQRVEARREQIGSGERSEKIRTYRWKEGIVADERLPGEYRLRDVMAGDLDALMRDLTEQETARRIAAL